MSESRSLESRYRNALAELEKRGQTHVLRFWDELGGEAHAALLTEIEAIPWEQLDPVIETHVVHTPRETVPTNLSPAPAFPLVPETGQETLYHEARAQGRELLAQGRVAAFTVAGGQGSRLGFDGPKGALPVSPIRHKTLFQLFAEIVRAARERYGASIPWYLMTSPANHTDTVEFLRRHDHFGLPEEDVVLFVQDMLPAFDFDGRILLESKDHIALAPSGHGGSLTSLRRSGALANMRERGVDMISYFQVDNPLVMPFDPLFVGLHRRQGSEMSSKVTSKTDDLEKVGNLCLADGRLCVIEYSDFPPELCRERDERGRRKFDLGNLAMHILDVEFADRIAGSGVDLPFHRAEKKVACVNESGSQETPTTPNAVKLEAFIFDALPLAANPLLLTIDRAEEFSPVKNPDGTDSVETAHRDQIRRAARWLEAAGIPVPRTQEGEPDATLEIASSFALDASELAERIDPATRIEPGESRYLD